MKVYELINLCKNNFTVFQFEEFYTCNYIGSYFFSELILTQFYYSDIVNFKISYSYEYGYTIWFWI